MLICVGWSAVTGAGELWIENDDSVLMLDIHKNLTKYMIIDFSFMIFFHTMHFWIQDNKRKCGTENKSGLVTHKVRT